jgi:aspartate/tyrosine/aromatic aminotransferase
MAEHRLWQMQETKGYISFAGDAGFIDALSGLVLGEAVPADRVAGIATPGGTGGVRQILELVRHLTPRARVWVSDPSWPNHAVIIDHLGLERRAYRYLDRDAGAVDRDGMRDDLAGVAQGDVILLHGCCHNPSGADLRAEDWDWLAGLCRRTGAIPFIDMAYQGFGTGLEEDAAGTRPLRRRSPKRSSPSAARRISGFTGNVRGWRLRSPTRDKPRAAAQAQLIAMNRMSFSFPPDHGARLVEMILRDPVLRRRWEAELEGMRGTMHRNRAAWPRHCGARPGRTGSGFSPGIRGMFSLCGATPEQVLRLRDAHGVYMVPDGRINVAGLTETNIPKVARALATVLG